MRYTENSNELLIGKSDMSAFTYVSYILMNLLGTAIFCYRFRRRKCFILRLILSLTVILGYEALRIFVLQNVAEDVFSYIGWLITWLLLCTVVYACFDCKLISSVFCATCGYCAQNLANRLQSVLKYLLRIGYDHKAAAVTVYVTVAVLVLAVLYFTYYRGKRKYIREPSINGVAQFFISVLLLIVIQLAEQAMASVSFDAQVRFYRHIISAVFTLLAFVLEYSLVSQKMEEDRNATLQQIMERERENYEFAQDIISNVNIKIHDLKHWISLFTSKDIDKGALSCIRTAVTDYDLLCNTGNKALDTVFTAKRFLCKRENVELTLMADGERLSFMSDADIFSLFGNIADNCIEAVEQLPVNKRVISIVVKAINDFVQIESVNYCTGEIRFDGELPKTTKKDKVNHGYGMLSIKSIVQKYKGTLRVKVNDGIFMLTILLPSNEVVSTE